MVRDYRTMDAAWLSRASVGVRLATSASDSRILARVSSPARTSWSQSLFLFIKKKDAFCYYYWCRAHWCCSLCYFGSDFHALYFHKFTYGSNNGPKIVRWTFLFICGISVTCRILLDRSNHFCDCIFGSWSDLLSMFYGQWSTSIPLDQITM